MLRIPARIWPLAPRLFATLSGVSGFTGRGSVVLSPSHGGAHKLTVQLSGLAGREAMIVINNEQSLRIRIEKGRAKHKFRFEAEQNVPVPVDGDQIDVVQNGEVVLHGVLTRK